MKSVILKLMLLFVTGLSLVKLSSDTDKNIKNQQRKNLRNFIKNNNSNNNSTLAKDDYNPFEILKDQEEDTKEKFNLDSIILNLSIIENKIKCFKNKLESKLLLILNNKNKYTSFQLVQCIKPRGYMK